MVEFEKEGEDMKEIFKGLSESLFGKKADVNKAVEQIEQLSVQLTGRGYGRKQDAYYQAIRMEVQEAMEKGEGIIYLGGGASRLRIWKDLDTKDVFLDLSPVSTEETKAKFRQITGGRDRVLLRRGGK